MNLQKENKFVRSKGFCNYTLHQMPTILVLIPYIIPLGLFTHTTFPTMQARLFTYRYHLEKVSEIYECVWSQHNYIVVGNLVYAIYVEKRFVVAKTTQLSSFIFFFFLSYTAVQHKSSWKNNPVNWFGLYSEVTTTGTNHLIPRSTKTKCVCFCSMSFAANIDILLLQKPSLLTNLIMKISIKGGEKGSGKYT